jgi:hypothetical protein
MPLCQHRFKVNIVRETTDFGKFGFEHVKFGQKEDD